jgi:hypothetical protein
VLLRFVVIVTHGIFHAAFVNCHAFTSREPTFNSSSSELGFFESTSTRCDVLRDDPCVSTSLSVWPTSELHGRKTTVSSDALHLHDDSHSTTNGRRSIIIVNEDAAEVALRR